jgi:transcriptional regulator with GAF, ATPase, and Fis domain
MRDFPSMEKEVKAVQEGRLRPVNEDYTQVAETFLELTGMITSGAETIEVFTELARKCVSLLPIAAAGILLRDTAGDLQVIGSSSTAAHVLDLYQVQREEGPCLESLNSGARVFDTHVGSTGRWPRFSALALEHEFTSVYALPLQIRNMTVGALNLFAKEPLKSDQLTIAQALADAAVLSLVQIDPSADNSIVIQRIHRAIESRNTLDQARGMITQRFGIDPEDALDRIVEVARETGLSVTEVARAVVRRDHQSPAFPLLAEA